MEIDVIANFDQGVKQSKTLGGCKGLNDRKEPSWQTAQ